MKSILYAGGALMLAAGIYGFADFKKTNTNSEFKNLYEEKEIVLPAAPGENDLVLPPEKPVSSGKEIKSARGIKVKQSKKVSTDQDQEIKEEKELSPELFSRAPLKEIPKIKKDSKADQ